MNEVGQEDQKGSALQKKIATAFHFNRFLGIAVSLAVLLLVVWSLRFLLSKPAAGREWIVFITAGALLVAAAALFFPPGRDMHDPKNVRFVISFDAVVFIVLGLAATFIECANWAAGGLLAGGCLLIGGFFGLLFGYPQGVAQGTSADDAAGTGKISKTLLAQSAATLGKVLAGFGLAKLNTLSDHFWRLCHTLGPAFGGANQSANHVIAALILTYFLSVGFLSGLLLPSYFMRDFLSDSIEGRQV